MFGCLRGIGCVVVLAVIGGVAFVTRDKWMGRISSPAAETPVVVVWEPLTDEGAVRARKTVESLGKNSGPVFANLGPGDLSSYLFVALAKQLPPSAKDIRAAVIGDQLYVKALVSLSDLGGSKVIGPLAALLSAQDTMSFGGRFEVVRPGLAQFVVGEIKLRDFSIPRGILPKIIAQIRRGSVPQGVSPTGLPLATPPYIGDVRIAKGKVTLYKSVP